MYMYWRQGCSFYCSFLNRAFVLSICKSRKGFGGLKKGEEFEFVLIRSLSIYLTFFCCPFSKIFFRIKNIGK